MWKPPFAFFFVSTSTILTGPLLLLLPCTLYIFNEKTPPLLSHLAYFPQRCLTTSTVLSRSSFLRGTRCPRPANTWCFSAGLQRTRVLNVTTRRRGMTSDRAGAQDQEVGRLQSVNIVLITKPKTTGKLKAFFFISVSGMSFSFLFLRNFT